MKVYAIHHDSYYPCLSRDVTTYIQPIKAGAALEQHGGVPGDFLRDDAEDEKEFSSRNWNWGELTAHHWLRRHTQDDIIGVCHYRRYLSPFNLDALRSMLGPGASSITHLLPEMVSEILALDPDGSNFIRMLKTVDLILPYPFIAPYRNSFQKEYLNGIPWPRKPVDWLAMRDAFRSVYQKEFIEASDYLTVSRNLHPILFIGRRKTVMSFWDWVFPILLEMEERLAKKSASRSLALVVEGGLLSWWLYSRPVSHAYLPILMPNDTFKPLDETWVFPPSS